MDLSPKQAIERLAGAMERIDAITEESPFQEQWNALSPEEQKTQYIDALRLYLVLEDATTR